MRWFRSHRRRWVSIALLALGLQLGLSFGHVHGIVPDHPAKAIAIAQGSGGNAAVPAPPASDDGTDYCAICAIMALLSGGQTATAPVVAPPAAVGFAEIATSEEVIRIAPRRAAFHSRAPPQA